MSAPDPIAAYASALVDAVEHAVGPWVTEAVARRHPGPPPASVVARAEQEAAKATVEVPERLAALLALDIDEQWTNPLSILRDAVTYPTVVLTEAGVAPVGRDETATRIHPEDVYDLGPATFADLGTEVLEPGIAWGAAKAHVHLRRHRDGAPERP